MLCLVHPHTAVTPSGAARTLPAQPSGDKAGGGKCCLQHVGTGWLQTAGTGFSCSIISVCPHSPGSALGASPMPGTRTGPGCAVAVYGCGGGWWATGTCSSGCGSGRVCRDRSQRDTHPGRGRLAFIRHQLSGDGRNWAATGTAARCLVPARAGWHHAGAGEGSPPGRRGWAPPRGRRARGCPAPAWPCRGEGPRAPPSPRGCGSGRCSRGWPG